MTDSDTSNEPGGLETGWRRIVRTAKNDFWRALRAGVPHVLLLVAGTRGMLFIQQIALARILTQEDLGRMSYVVRIMMLITVVADVGMCTAVLKYAAEPIEEARRNDIYRTGMIYGALCSVGVACLYVIAVMCPGALGAGEALRGPMLVVALYIPLSALAKIPPLFLQARKQIKKASLTSMITNAIGIGLVITGAAAFGLWGFFVAMVLSPALQASAFLSITRRFLTGARSSFAAFRRLFRFAQASMFTNVLGTANACLSLLMVKWLTQDDRIVATYAVATYVQTGLRWLPQSILQTAFPYLSQLLGDPGRLRRRIRELAVKQFFVVGSVALVFAGVGFWLMPLVFGAKYQGSFVPAVVLTAGVTVWSCGSPFGQALLVMDRVPVNLILALVQLAISVVSCINLIPRYGALGAAIGTALATSAASVLWVVVGSYILKRYRPAIV